MKMQRGFAKQLLGWEMKRLQLVETLLYRHTLNPKYVAYFFQTSRFLEHKIQYSTGAKVVRMSAALLAFYFSRIDIFYTFVEK